MFDSRWSCRIAFFRFESSSYQYLRFIPGCECCQGWQQPSNEFSVTLSFPPCVIRNYKHVSLHSYNYEREIKLFIYFNYLPFFIRGSNIGKNGLFWSECVDEKYCASEFSLLFIVDNSINGCHDINMEYFLEATHVEHVYLQVWIHGNLLTMTFQPFISLGINLKRLPWTVYWTLWYVLMLLFFGMSPNLNSATGIIVMKAIRCCCF